MTRTFALCADDFGLSPGIDRAILDLAERGRLSAVSCMTGAAQWRTDAAALVKLHDKVDIGLHLTLVDERPLTAMPHHTPNGVMPGITALILRSHLGLLPRDEIRAEIAAQFDAFEAATGFVPDHIDGHLHTHVLPGVRDLVLELARTRAPKAWLRNVTEPISRLAGRASAGKAMVLNILGRRFETDPALAHAGNQGFSGLSSFDPAANYAHDFEKFVADIGPRHLVMCHPSSGDAQSRANEYRFLGSDEFPALLARRGLSLARWSRAA